MKPLFLKDLLVLNAYWVGLSFMWNSLHVIILPAVLVHWVPGAQKNTYLGLLTFLGLVIAMIVQPISGALSDGWVSAWGRRRPLISLGTLFDFLFLAFLGWAGGLGWIALGYIGLQLSSNVAHGPLQGLLPDRTPPEQLGQASGIKNLMDMAGLVAASLIMGRVMQPEATRPLGAVGLVAVVLAAGAAVTLFGVREEPALERRTATGGWFDAFRIDLRAYASYAWLIGSRFFYLVGVYGIQVFSQYYIRDVLAYADPIRLTGDLMATITLTLICFTLVGGWLGDRVGHKKISYVASAVGALGCFMLLWARTPTALLIFGALLGAGVGLFLTANWALCNRLAPSDQAGKFLGLTNLATAGAGALGRLQGPFIDLLNNANPGAWWGYSELFLAGAVCTLISAALLVKVSAK